MSNYIKNIEAETLANEYFRSVIYTDARMQLVLMAIQPNENIPKETHKDVDQFIRIEQGEGKAILNGEEFLLEDGGVIIIPKGTEHEIVNTSSTNPLKLYTIYTPPEHAEGTVHKTRSEAIAAEEHYEG